MGGGRTAPNPSTKLDVYDPPTNTWTTDLPFVTPRRNFPTDTDGTTRIWLAGGYTTDGFITLSTMEKFCNAGGNSNSDANTHGDGNCYSDGDSDSDSNRHGNCHSNTIGKSPYANAARSPD